MEIEPARIDIEYSLTLDAGEVVMMFVARLLVEDNSSTHLDAQHLSLID